MPLRHLEGPLVRPLLALDLDLVDLERGRGEEAEGFRRVLLHPVRLLGVARQRERLRRRQELAKHILVRLDDRLDEPVRVAHEEVGVPVVLAPEARRLAGVGVLEDLRRRGVAEVLAEEPEDPRLGDLAVVEDPVDLLPDPVPDVQLPFRERRQERLVRLLIGERERDRPRHVARGHRSPLRRDLRDLDPIDHFGVKQDRDHELPRRLLRAEVFQVVPEKPLVPLRLFRRRAPSQDTPENRAHRLLHGSALAFPQGPELRDPVPVRNHDARELVRVPQVLLQLRLADPVGGRVVAEPLLGRKLPGRPEAIVVPLESQVAAKSLEELLVRLPRQPPQPAPRRRFRRPLPREERVVIHPVALRGVRPFARLLQLRPDPPHDPAAIVERGLLRLLGRHLAVMELGEHFLQDVGAGSEVME